MTVLPFLRAGQLVLPGEDMSFEMVEAEFIENVLARASLLPSCPLQQGPSCDPSVRYPEPIRRTAGLYLGVPPSAVENRKRKPDVPQPLLFGLPKRGG